MDRTSIHQFLQRRPHFSIPDHILSPYKEYCDWVKTTIYTFSKTNLEQAHTITILDGLYEYTGRCWKKTINSTLCICMQNIIRYFDFSFFERKWKCDSFSIPLEGRVLNHHIAQKQCQVFKNKLPKVIIHYMEQFLDDTHVNEPHTNPPLFIIENYIMYLKWIKKCISHWSKEEYYQQKKIKVQTIYTGQRRKPTCDFSYGKPHPSSSTKKLQVLMPQKGSLQIFPFRLKWKHNEMIWISYLPDHQFYLPVKSYYTRWMIQLQCSCLKHLFPARVVDHIRLFLTITTFDIRNTLT